MTAPPAGSAPTAPATAHPGRARGALSLLLCLLVVAGLAAVTGGPADDVPIDYADVGVGEVGHAQRFDVEVTAVQLGRQVQRDATSEPLAAGATDTFVVVEIVLDARTEETPLSNVWLLTADGTRYAPRGEFVSAGPPLTPVGFTSTGSYVFQVPVDRVDGARLLAEPEIPLFLTYDTTVRVDLGLDGTTAIGDTPIALAPATTEVTR